MSSATTSYVDHAVDLYCEIYGNEMERQSDVYTQNNMELFEKVWVAGRGATEEEEQDERDRITASRAGQDKDKTTATKQRQEQGWLDEQVDDSAALVLNDWPEIPDQGPSSMLWTCDICEKRMSVLSRGEHIASEHPPKGKQSPRPRRQRKKKEKKAGGEGGMPMWQCELCDEEVNIFYTAEHVAGKKHVMKLKESGEYQDVPPPEEFVEQRAVYKPHDSEEVLEGVEDEHSLGLEEIQGSQGYLEERAVYRPAEGEKFQDNWEPDGTPGGSESLEKSAVYQLEEKEEEDEEEDDDDDWEAQDNKIYRPLAEDQWKLEKPEEAGALNASVNIPNQEKLPPLGPSHQNFLQKVAGSQLQSPFLSQTCQAPIHIQVETFNCDLCDTEYPLSERKFHSDETFECVACEDEFHLSARSDHLASREHIRCAEAKGGIAKVSMPKVVEPQDAVSQKLSGSFHCELCGITMQMDSRRSHLAGMKHRTKQESLSAAKEQAPWRARTPRAPEPRSSSSTSGFYAKLNDTVPPSTPRALFTPPRLYYSVSRTVVNSDARESHVSSVSHKALNAAKSNQQSASKPTNPPVTVPIRSRANDPPLQVAQPGPSNSVVSSVEKGMFHCDICNRTMVGDFRDSHLRGFSHKAKEDVLIAEEAAGENRAVGAPQTMVESEEKFTCRPCGVTLGPKDLECHFNGKKHLANTTQAAVEKPGVHSSGPSVPPTLPIQFHCKPCDMVLPIANRVTHLSSKKHKKKELAYRPQLTKKVVTEVALTKIDGGVVADSCWCEICLKNISERDRDEHKTGAWSCKVCGIKTHSGWREIHQNTVSHRLAESKKTKGTEGW